MGDARTLSTPRGKPYCIAFRARPSSPPTRLPAEPPPPDQGATMERTFQHIETKLVHAGEPHPRLNGSVAMPIFQTAMFETKSDGNADYHDLRYIRLNNTPNHVALNH